MWALCCHVTAVGVCAALHIAARVDAAPFFRPVDDAIFEVTQRRHGGSPCTSAYYARILCYSRSLIPRRRTRRTASLILPERSPALLLFFVKIHGSFHGRFHKSSHGSFQTLPRKIPRKRPLKLPALPRKLPRKRFFRTFPHVKLPWKWLPWKLP